MKKRAAVLGAASTLISTKLISEIAADETPIPKFTSRPAVALNAKEQCEIQSSQLTGERYQKELSLLARAVNAYIDATEKDRQAKRGIEEVHQKTRKRQKLEVRDDGREKKSRCQVSRTSAAHSQPFNPLGHKRVGQSEQYRQSIHQLAKPFLFSNFDWNLTRPSGTRSCQSFSECDFKHDRSGRDAESYQLLLPGDYRAPGLSSGRTIARRIYHLSLRYFSELQ
ncbi:uncharacterized protein PpBr36_05772 [Pyricularia pennisetigena]|uniref:uncharacterized protein n=1 Tax=Pyricularia pennisetigena TaxID=1578925 RepID=UPI001150E5C0|nr:uncharacterized protein PpBr36_05772 [Pyricularia pennisetigena]TLS22740.1 hypothetical protein PpBr36_05772 [Pyricularia pennisetigena]